MPSWLLSNVTWWLFWAHKECSRSCRRSAKGLLRSDWHAMETHVRTAYSTYTAQKTPRHHFSNHNKFPGRQKGHRFNKNFPKNMKTVVFLYKDEICVSVCIPHAACVHAFYITHNIPTRHKMRESDVRGSLSAPTAFIPDGCALRNKIFPASIRKREYFIEERKREPPLVHTHTHIHTLMWKEPFGCCWWSERSVLLPRHQVIYLSESGYLWLPGWLTQVLKSQTKVGRAKSFCASASK